MIDWESRYYGLLHILQASKELFSDDVEEKLCKRKHDKIRKAFWDRIDEEVRLNNGEK